MWYTSSHEPPLYHLKSSNNLLFVLGSLLCRRHSPHPETVISPREERIFLNQNNAATTSNISIIPPRPDNLHEAIDVLHTSQITGDYRYSAMALAGPLMTEVGRVFSQHMILIYLTTSYKRRQVWNAYIAAMFANPENPQPITDPVYIRNKILNTSSKQLLQEAYGAIPEGFQNALERLGVDGEEPRVYLLLHKLMSGSDDLKKSFSFASKIEASTIITLAALPHPLQSYDLASQFRKPEDIKTLLFMIDTLGQGDQAKYSDLCAIVVGAAKRGHSVSAVLKREYYLTPFPESAIGDTDFCKHIRNAFELKKTAKQFCNCLRDYCESGIRGEYQYFRWYEVGQVTAIISIREDIPFGFRIDEIQGPRNEFIDDQLELKIVKHFESHGVHKQPSMEALIRQLGYLGVVNRGRRDPVDEIHGVIDELLDG